MPLHIVKWQSVVSSGISAIVDRGFAALSRRQDHKSNQRKVPVSFAEWVLSANITWRACTIGRGVLMGHQYVCLCFDPIVSYKCVTEKRLCLLLLHPQKFEISGSSTDCILCHIILTIAMSTYTTFIYLFIYLFSKHNVSLCSKIVSFCCLKHCIRLQDYVRLQ